MLKRYVILNVVVANFAGVISDTRDGLKVSLMEETGTEAGMRIAESYNTIVAHRQGHSNQ